MQNGLKLWIFFSWTTICSGTIQVNKVIQFMIWLPLSLLYLQCIFCNCYNIDQGVFCKYSMEWCGLCVEKVRWCQCTFIFYTKEMHNILTLIKSYFWSTLHKKKKKKQSLQPDKHHKLNKTGVVALLKPVSFTTDFSATSIVLWKLKCTVSKQYKRSFFWNRRIT